MHDSLISVNTSTTVLQRPSSTLNLSPLSNEFVFPLAGDTAHNSCFLNCPCCRKKAQIIMYSVLLLRSQCHEVIVQILGSEGIAFAPRNSHYKVMILTKQPPLKISKQLSEYTKQIFTAHKIAFNRTGFAPQLNITSLWLFAKLTTSGSKIKMYNLSDESAVSPIGQCAACM